MNFPLVGTYVKVFRGKTTRRRITTIETDRNLIKWHDPDAKVTKPRGCSLKTWNDWLTVGGFV
jgi:hypothetical protein